MKWLNITMVIYNCILMVRAWVWALTIVELIANCFVSIYFEMIVHVCLDITHLLCELPVTILETTRPLKL